MTVPIPTARLAKGWLEINRPEGGRYQVAFWPELEVLIRTRGIGRFSSEIAPIDAGLSRHEWVGVLPSIEPFRRRGRETDQLMLFSPTPPPVSGIAGESAVAWRSFLGAIPQHVLEGVVRFRAPHLQLLRSVARNPCLLDLMCSTPALAWALAHSGVLGEIVATSEAERLLEGRQRVLSGRLGFGETEAAVRLLRKVPMASIQAAPILALRQLLRQRETACFLGHMPRVNLGVLLLLDAQEGRTLAKEALLREVAERREEDLQPQTLLLLQDLRQMGALLGRPLERYGTIESVRTIHNEMVCQVNLRPKAAPREPEILLRQTLRWPAPSRVRPFPSPPFPGSEDGSIVPLDSISALEQEGKVMHHCVAAYAALIQGGSSYVYRVMEPERATAELRMTGRGWHLWQLHGRGNVGVSNEARRAVEEWMAGARRVKKFAQRIPRHQRR